MKYDAFLALRGVSKRFGDVSALDTIDLDVRRGEFMTLLGQSGCGKTTTLRLVAGFEQLSSGVIELEGRRIDLDAPFRRPINTVFQSYALFPHMTVGENVGYGLRFDRVSRQERRRRAEEILGRMGLSDNFASYPRMLSGGQMQRVALARALIKQPSVLLLDEPLSALDAKLRKDLQLELKRTQRDTGVTFIYVTHDQEEALVMSDRITVMDAGTICQTGTPEEIFRAPTSRFVAEFVGQSNKLMGEIVGHQGGKVCFKLTSGELLHLTPCGKTQLHQGSRARAVLRSGDLQRSDDGRADLSGMLRDVIFFGDSRKLVVSLGDGTDVEITEDINCAAPPRPGNLICLTVTSSPVHLFEAGDD